MSAYPDRARPPGRLAARARPPGRRAGRLRAPRRLRPLPRRDPRSRWSTRPPDVTVRAPMSARHQRPPGARRRAPRPRRRQPCWQPTRWCSRRASSRPAPRGPRTSCAARRASSPTRGRRVRSTRSTVIDGDVLLVGTGLTMVDLALTLARPGRTLHAVSRRGRVPAAHTHPAEAAHPGAEPRARRASRPVVAPTDLATMRDWSARSVTARGARDRRLAAGLRHPPAADGRPLDPARRRRARRLPDRRRGLVGPAPAPDAADLGRCRSPGCAPRAPCRSSSDEVSTRSTRPPTGSTVWLASGRRVDGRRGRQLHRTAGRRTPGGRPAARRPDRHRAPRTAGSMGLGLRTDAGRLVDSTGSAAAAIWTLGAMRRGELWESTAVPEIRSQAADGRCGSSPRSCARRGRSGTCPAT